MKLPELDLPPGLEGGIRIFSNGTPEGTHVVGPDGKPMGLIDRIELVVDKDQRTVIARVDFPVSYLDMKAEQVGPCENKP